MQCVSFIVTYLVPIRTMPVSLSTIRNIAAIVMHVAVPQKGRIQPGYDCVGWLVAQTMTRRVQNGQNQSPFLLGNTPYSLAGHAQSAKPTDKTGLELAVSGPLS
jgi:hypothetical protein